jgi:hypothetical protein
LLREQAGTLTGAAVGAERHMVNALEDVQTVFGKSGRLLTSKIPKRVARLCPEVYTR